VRVDGVDVGGVSRGDAERTLERHAREAAARPVLVVGPLGREATISWGGPELIFRNDWPAGVLIDLEAGETSITVRFSSWLGRRVETDTSTTTAMAEVAPPSNTRGASIEGGDSCATSCTACGTGSHGHTPPRPGVNDATRADPQEQPREDGGDLEH
jgi:VanW like protein